MEKQNIALGPNSMVVKKRLRGRPKHFYDKGTQNRIQSLDRALNVLGCLTSNPGMTLTEIAEHLEQAPATIYRILSTYENRKIVEMDPANQEWFIGSESFRFGSAYLRRSGVVERARSVMHELMEETGETANLGIEVSGAVMFVSQVETMASIRAFFPPGTKSPMHASGIGKVILAHAKQSVIEEYVARDNLETFTDKTIANEAGLRTELKKIKDQGYSVDDEEKNIGMRCVAAAIFNFHNEVIAGISISGPSNRLPQDRVSLIGQIVKQKAALLSA